MKGKKLRAIFAAISLSLLMATGVYAASETETDVLQVEETDVESTEELEEETVIGEGETETDVTPTVEEESEVIIDEVVDETPEEVAGETEESAQITTGWFTNTDGIVSYLDENGVPVTGYQTIGKYTFYFNEAGELQLGMQTDPETGSIRYFKKTGDDGIKGAMLVGWNKIGSQYYYFDPNGEAGDTKGVMATGWKQIGDNTFYFGEADSATPGVMARGWNTINNKIYYFKASGVNGTRGMLFTGFKNVSGKIYYFTADGEDGVKGQMLTGWKTIDGKDYFFKRTGEYGTKGQMFTGWKNVDGKIFYFTPSGKYGVLGSLKTGWLTLDGKKYRMRLEGALGKRGELLTGWRTIGNYRYYFKKSGVYGVKGQAFTGLISIDGGKYYFNSKGMQKTGWQKINGQWYYFDPSDGGKMVTGWKYIKTTEGYRQFDWFKFYFRENGTLCQDLDKEGIAIDRSSFRAEVDRVNCVVTIYAKETSGKFKGQYRIPVKAMTCSVGLPSTPTPLSSYTWPYKTVERGRWVQLMGPSYGQYCTRVVASIYFHSVAGSHMSSYNLSAGAYNMLGQPASHGCIRLCVRDAKWIYDNCALGMEVIIRDNMYQPFEKPATIKIPAGQNWDPTDPAV